MKSVVVGTAGHIDHGKTALVKALTGIDADRLEEEKRRGITIDIGFAHLELPAALAAAGRGTTPSPREISSQHYSGVPHPSRSEGRGISDLALPSAAPLRQTAGDCIRFGFVDVPGHERFVRNMLAGVGGIDMVVLVVAADESVKPQTREHFDICRLLSIKHGLTVLTKADLVDADTLDVVRLEVEDFVRGSFLEGAPIVAVSSHTGQGMDELKNALVEVAMRVPAKDSAAPFRLPVDRVFTMRGFGTVVTGTSLSGTVHKEEELEVFPDGRRVRVRGIQVHGAAAERAMAGQRTALNVAGAGVEELARGMVLAPPQMFHAARHADVQITLLPSARPLKNRARVHFHAHTTETLAAVRLLGAKVPLARAANAGNSADDVLKPGQASFARLTLEHPVLLLPGDRFIIRQFSPVITIGGGVVLDTRPLRVVAPNSPFACEHFLPLMLSGDDQELLHSRIARRFSEGFSVADAVAETGWTRERVEHVLGELAKTKRIVRVADKLADSAVYESLKTSIPVHLEAQLEKTRLAGGIGKEQLRDRHTDPILHEAILAQLVQAGKLEVSGDLVRLPGKGVQLRDEEAEAKNVIEQAFASAGLKVPALKEVLAGLRVDRARAQKIVTLLLRDRVLVKLSEELVFHQAALDALKKDIAAIKATSPKIDVAKFKDMTGVSRKYAIPLLEYLDRERVTRRVGDERVIL